MLSLVLSVFVHSRTVNSKGLVQCARRANLTLTPQGIQVCAILVTV